MEIKKMDFWDLRPIYVITENGDVYNIKRRKKHSVHIADDGYLTIKLYTKSRDKVNFRVNRLVCRAFHGEPPFDDAVAEHIDNDPLNNHKDNIRWGTHSSNQYWHRKTKGVRTGDLLESDVYDLCRMIRDGFSTHDILKHFKIGSKKKDHERFTRFVRRISAIKKNKLYNDVYKEVMLEGSTTIENDDYYNIIIK